MRFSMASITTSLSTLHATGLLRWANHSRPDSNFRETSALPYSRSCALICPLPTFAFLSACHTAEVTEGSITDEGLHLAAAVQYCGFRSVVGTMWAMMDEDGQDLANNFYKSLFSDSRREEGIPYHERSAKALRFAVKKLRRKRRITLERWVNFVHYGA